MRLTDLQIRKLKAPERGQKTYFDDALPGFGVRISQGGTRSFVVMYGRQRRLRTVGRYPAMSLADARIEAKRTQAEVSDPPLAAGNMPPAISFNLARQEFLADCDRRNKASTAGEYRRLLLKHFSFEKNLTELSRTEIVEVLDELVKAPSEQRHAFVALRTMLNWCHKRGYLESSPMPHQTMRSEPSTRTLTDDELATVWHRAVDIGYPYGRIIQLLILTGQRRGEIAGLRRSWIKDDQISYPPGFAKNKREHVVPLGPMALELIASTPDCGELLFPARGREDVPFSGWSKSKRTFDQAIDVADYTLHDLRRTFSSTMARLGTPIHVTEKLLNHVSGTISGVAAIYNRHSYWNEMCAAVSRYEAHLKRLIAAGGSNRNL